MGSNRTPKFRDACIDVGRRSAARVMDAVTTPCDGRGLKYAAVVSLFLAGATLVLWVVSYRVEHHLGRHRVQLNGEKFFVHRAGVFVADGRIAMSSGSYEDDAKSDPVEAAQAGGGDHGFRYGLFQGDFGAWHHERDEDFILGFGTNHSGVITDPTWDSEHWWVASVPLAVPLVAFLIVPTTRFLAPTYGWSTRRIAFYSGMAGVVLLVAAGVAIPLAVCFAPLLLGLSVVGLVIGINVHVGNVLSERARRRRGLCTACGYDLRATPTRCPECGRESRTT